MPVSTTDLTARIRERAAGLDAGGSGHWPACYDDYRCICADHQPGALVRVVEDVLELHYAKGPIESRYCASSCHDWPCETIRALATSLGVPTESEPCREHRGGA